MALPANAAHTSKPHPSRVEPPRLSPLQRIHQGLGAQSVSRGGWQVPHAYMSPHEEASAIRERVAVADMSWPGKLIVRGEAAQELLARVWGVTPSSLGQVSEVPRRPEAGQHFDGSYVARLAADEYLVITPPGAEADAVQALEQACKGDDLFVTVINQTSGLAGLAVAGPEGHGLLSKLCALPLGPADFPDRRVAQTSLAKVHTLLLRNDLSGSPAFELYFERPYAEYVWESILDAGREYGIIPFGWGAAESLVP